MNEERLKRELNANRLLVVHFDLESQVFDHAPDFGGRLAGCREVAVHEDGVGRIEGERLKASEVVFPSAGDADFGVRVKKAEEAEGFQAALRSPLIAVL